ncbi:sulfotransferase domain-containing protein [Shimia haliotis]|uniref:Aryl sulfotransferase n=1 Tax=Shimia haliotis TaxID=1280847 RepID=A0A1I4ATJ2_9RHOB|nr:sulfotransferase domain-containing protein [Shimia haliotis]SFK59603.1 aryl sulfotransferase [Shimia haliotis]
MKTRKLYLGPLTDNRRWDMVAIRPDDVFVVTPPKSGTTWMQTIVALLLSGDPEVETDLAMKMPWVDFRMREMSDVAERIEAMQHRRSLKSHTPMDGLPLDDNAQYICVFRHPLDVHFSFRQHVRNIPLAWFDAWYPEDDPDRIAIRRFLDGGAEGFDADNTPLAHILRHYKAAVALADRPNVSLFHYADMVRDLPSTVARLSTLLGTSYSESVIEQLVSAATFANMKNKADRYVPAGGKGFFKSDTDFFHSGTRGKWHGQLTDAELATYDAIMCAELPSDQREWLEHGSGDMSD